MEFNTEKSKLMADSTSNTSTSITMHSRPLEKVSNFKYLRAILSKDDTFNAEIRIYIDTATAAMGQTEKDVEMQH